MNIQFSELLQQKRVTLNELPNEIKEDISEYNSILSDYNASIIEINSLDDEEEKMEAQADLNEIKELLSETNDIIVNKITEWHQDNVGKTAQRPNSVPNSASQQQGQVNPNVAKDEDKEDSWGWLIFGGLVAVVTLGAVRIYKNR